jgi:CubicO group peptidase (beta-lactamase class C family)
MKSLKLAVFFLTIIVITAVPIAQAAAPAIDQTTFIEQVEETLPKLMARYNVPGFSIAIIENGDIVYLESFGYADQKNRTPMTPDTIHQVASVSKSLTAWGVMKLVDDGVINLDDPVEKYLTRWHIPPSPYDTNGVTIRRLLNHTAGISLSGYGAGVPVDQPLPSLEASLSGDTRGCGSVELVRQPGEGFMYSGGGYTILQLMVEEVTSQTFGDYMKTNILNPLGMENSTFVWNETVQSQLAQGYGTYHNPIPNYRYIEDAAGGLYSTPADMARFAQAIVNGSNIISEESFNLLFDGETYGLGHAVIDFPTGHHFIFGGGTRMGWQSDFVMSPQERSGIVLLTNANGGIIMNLDIINLWTQWKTSVSWPGAELFLYQYPVLWGIAIILASICVIFSLYLWRQDRQNKRIFLFNSSEHNKIIRILLIGLFLTVTTLWWLFGFTTTFDPQAQMLWMPEPFLWVSVFWSWLMALLIVSNLFPKSKTL